MLCIPMLLLSEVVALSAMNLLSSIHPEATPFPAERIALAPAPAPIAAPSAAKGDEPFALSYTYLEVGYFSTDVDAIDESTDAYRARASLGLFEFLFVFVDYAREDIDFDGGDVESDSFGLGLGAHFDVTPNLDAVGEVSWVYDDLTSDTLSDLDDSNDGWTAFAGGRWLALPMDRGGLELNGGFRWIDREAILSDDEVGAWEVGARMHFLNAFSVGAKYEFLEDDGRWGADLRFSF